MVAELVNRCHSANGYHVRHLRQGCKAEGRPEVIADDGMGEWILECSSSMQNHYTKSSATR